MSEHTPGPWSLEKKRTQFHISGANGQLSLELHGNQFAAEANARLIAAAPKMYEVLEEIAAHLDDSYVDGCLERMLGDKARDAIAAVKGSDQ